MKKLIALMMAIAMLLTMSCAALADEINWADYEAAAAEIDPDGALMQVADYSLAMWVPSIFTEQELTEENIAEGYISVLAPADESAAIIIMKDEGVEADLEAWQQGFIEAGYEDAEVDVINGVQALTYSDKENDMACVLYKIVDSNEVLQFSFAPMSDEGFAALAFYMAASLQPME